ncbi:MAG TPA: sulfatase-like hydrolase/transferase, partial [Bryobacteraceae bacterium]|nr:sulfatase-like hydrolase/transferase [Bryobacteraceae bacterium]
MPINRRNFLYALGGGAAAWGQPKKQPTNVVFILADDWGWTDLGCYGSRYYQTPNLDRLASQGMRFTNAYAACPVCSPTRASILTGRYPARLHLTDWIPGRKQWPSARVITPQFEQQLPLEEVTIPEMLKPAGYRSAAIGKWHLGQDPYSP